MKPFIFSAIAIFLLSFTNRNTNTINLTVEVHELRNNKGLVQFALYNKNGTIPDENFEKYYQIGKTTIKGNAAQFVFKNLPKGTYAVNILHDEDKDGEIDKGWVLPTEGIGFSNINKIGIGNKPNFKKAKFELSTAKKINVTVIYL
ncbi:MAG: DUF2141 domain-containing protein [Flavobacteriales bacterium]|nr:DUF2141 domain-containing protein [Flavobacteriales bacterium]